jgi:sporulation protein YlmC with PRC-barrel domain
MLKEVSTIIGQEIYTLSGEFIGIVDDIIFDPKNQKATSIAISEANRSVFDTENSKIIIPYRWVHSAEDVLVLFNIHPKIQSDPDQE